MAEEIRIDIASAARSYGLPIHRPSAMSVDCSSFYDRTLAGIGLSSQKSGLVTQKKPTRADIGRSLPALKLLKPSGGDASTKLILLPDRRREREEERRAVTKNSESPGFLLWLALQLMLAIRWRTMDEP
ncbi:hypothetical protein THAR02_00935 [Trichoderma harzianum]|uniref:Uncharacterized protein n=1 Tax=Trichoderma harzianum TaxID=5544 RepID=A0A0F9XR22_TRIHA|nr:hypothetical protein THAR02_00935 [Trichoderma harzianum]